MNGSAEVRVEKLKKVKVKKTLSISLSVELLCYAISTQSSSENFSKLLQNFIPCQILYSHSILSNSLQ